MPAPPRARSVYQIASRRDFRAQLSLAELELPLWPPLYSPGKARYPAQRLETDEIATIGIIGFALIFIVG